MSASSRSSCSSLNREVVGTTSFNVSNSSSTVPPFDAGVDPCDTAHPSYFKKIDEFYSAYIPCIALLASLQARDETLQHRSPTEDSSAPFVRQVSQQELLRRFLDAFARLCDIPYIGDTCTALAIADQGEDLVLYISSNQTRHATKCMGFARELTKCLSHHDLTWNEDEVHESIRREVENHRHCFPPNESLRTTPFNQDDEVEHLLAGAVAIRELRTIKEDMIHVVQQPAESGTSNSLPDYNDTSIILGKILERLRPYPEFSPLLGTWSSLTAHAAPVTKNPAMIQHGQLRS